MGREAGRPDRTLCRGPGKSQGDHAGADAESRDTLTTKESIALLDAYGVRVCRSALAKTEDEAVAIANSIGYPIVMKMTSKTTSHKTDVGGVRVGIASEEALRREYRDLIAKLTERGLDKGLEGVLIQEMVKSSREWCAVSPPILSTAR